MRFAAAILAASILPFAAYAEGSSRQVTFTKDVAPILMENCVTCHRPGEVAPMSLLSYQEARPWAKSMKKAVSEGMMPPFKVDPNHGKWANDMRLTQNEIDTIVAWADLGAPQGNPADMPAAPDFSTGWKLGEPDFILELPAVDVPAQGDDLFPDQVVRINLPEQKWVRAIEFQPGDKRVVHHILALLGDFGMSSEGSEDRQRQGTQAEIFSVWVAGSQPTVYPEGAGRIIQKNQVMTFNMHYHASGTATTDVTRVGLHWGKGELQKRISTTFAVNTGFRIPPNADNHRVTAHYVFDQDSKITSFLPHMHVRGKDMTYTATYPDGRSEILLRVPQYDYNWQWLYYPAEHIRIPAGTRVDVEAHYDNSTNNVANPNPNNNVYYRDETFQEMFVGFMEFIVDDGVAPKPTPMPQKIDLLLAAHPANDSYMLNGLIGMPWGLYLPRDDAEARWYIVFGHLMFTNTIFDLQWDGDNFEFLSGMVTQGGGGISMRVKGTMDAAGTMTGTVYLGEMENAADPKQPVRTFPFSGKNRATTNVAMAES